MKVSLFILVALQFFWGSALRADNSRPVGEKGYLARTIEGEVLYRSPSAIRWLPLKAGNFIPDGYLLQVEDNASAYLERRIKNRKRLEVDTDSDLKHLIIRKPTIVRVSDQLSRKIQLTRRFEESVKIAKADAQNKKAWYFDEAWKRLALMVKGSRPGQEIDQNEDMSIVTGDKTTNISVLTPTANSLVRRDDRPFAFRAVWSSPGAAENFQVYFWKVDAPRGDPVANTKARSYSVSVRDDGAYFLQVESSQGKSLPVRVFLETRKDGAEPAPLQMPLAGQKFFTNESSMWVRFQWVPTNGTNSMTLHVERLEDGEKLKFKPASDRAFTTASFSPGTYEWYLEDALRNKSETRVFSVVKQNVSISDLSKLSVGTQHTVVYLDDLK